MQIRRLGFVLTLLPLAVLAAATERSLPPHPTVLFAEYNGERHLVIAADKDKPVIEIGGQRRSLSSDTPMFTERVPGYGEASAQIDGLKGGRPQWLFRDHYASAFKQETSLRITSTQPLQDCFILLISYEDEFLLDEASRQAVRKKNAEIRDRETQPPQIRVQQITDLAAGQATPIVFTSTVLVQPRFTNLPLPPERTTFTNYQLFSRGQEVRTNTLGEAAIKDFSSGWEKPSIQSQDKAGYYHAPRDLDFFRHQPGEPAAYYHHREKMLQAALLKKWLVQNRGANQPLKPILQIPPLFESTDGLPPNAAVTLFVSADGAVTDVKLDGAFPGPAGKVLTDTFSAWLFLPKLEAGTPIAAKVKIPLTF